tara:strand:+ start:1831 stop:2934 length:1104 start_codon:yes stop_codon:yes gene_type:complete
MLPSLAALTLRTDMNTYIDEDPNYYYSDEEEWDGDLELLKASFEGNIAMVRLALNRGAKVDGKRQGGKTALMMAAKNGHLKIVDLLLNYGDAVIDQGDWEGETALNKASFAGHLDVVKFLLEEGAEIDRMSDNGWTALSNAVGGNHLAVVKFLLKSGANIELKDDSKATILMIASLGAHVDIVELLLDHGAKIEEVDYQGWTALMWAVDQMNPAIVNSLLARGAKFGNELITQERTRLARTREAEADDPGVMSDLRQRNIGLIEEILSLLEDSKGIRRRYLLKKFGKIANAVSWVPRIMRYLQVVVAMKKYRPPDEFGEHDGGAGYYDVLQDFEARQLAEILENQRKAGNTSMSFSEFLRARMRGNL